MCTCSFSVRAYLSANLTMRYGSHLNGTFMETSSQAGGLCWCPCRGISCSQKSIVLGSVSICQSRESKVSLFLWRVFDLDTAQLLCGNISISCSPVRQTNYPQAYIRWSRYVSFLTFSPYSAVPVN